MTAWWCAERAQQSSSSPWQSRLCPVQAALSILLATYGRCKLRGRESCHSGLQNEPNDDCMMPAEISHHSGFYLWTNSASASATCIGTILYKHGVLGVDRNPLLVVFSVYKVRNEPKIAQFFPPLQIHRHLSQSKIYQYIFHETLDVLLLQKTSSVRVQAEKKWYPPSTPWMDRSAVPLSLLMSAPTKS